MIFRPFYVYASGCASYVFDCGGLGKCAIVDPRDDLVDDYVAFAAAKGMAITHVFETHVHADHRSGGRRLSALTGAQHCLHRSANVEFDFVAVDDDDVIVLGNTTVRVLHTPGHTPEGVSLVVSDLRRGPAPWFVCTGDTLFVGAVGRPDLPGDTANNVRQLQASLQKLRALEPTVEVYPAHFGGSACGQGLSGKPCSTIGFETRFNPLLSADVDALGAALADVAARPADIDAIVAFNRGVGP